MSEPYYQDDAVTLHNGDCLDVLRELPDASVHAIVTDPPAGIGFMGRTWDHHKGGRRQWIAWLAEVMAEALRVTKPGGHALVWALPRTSHWTATALEDAGWEVRDCITHLFGSGFPKSLDVSKAIDREAGAEREVARERTYADGAPARVRTGTDLGIVNDDGWKPVAQRFDTVPATDAALKWQGWGTALKPASEHWWLARKPLTGTVAQTVLQHGTGALNIDASRVAGDGGGTRCTNRDENGVCRGHAANSSWATTHGPEGDGAAGRWPPNVVLDGAAADELDTQSGTSVSQGGSRGQGGGRGTYNSVIPAQPDVEPGYGDAGGASRYFPTFRYEAKAPTFERPRVDGVAHPTTKPLDLMRWLVRLVTPPGGTILEPFAGSGTTCEAAVIEGFQCIAIERDETYLPLIVARLTKPIQVALDFDGGAA